MTIELKHCPCCPKGRGELHTYTTAAAYGTRASVGCSECGLETRTFGSVEEAVAAWDQRVELSGFKGRQKERPMSDTPKDEMPELRSDPKQDYAYLNDSGLVHFHRGVRVDYLHKAWHARAALSPAPKSEDAVIAKKILLECADDLEAAARELITCGAVARGIKKTILVTRAAELRKIAAQSAQPEQKIPEVAYAVPDVRTVRADEGDIERNAGANPAFGSLSTQPEQEGK